MNHNSLKDKVVVITGGAGVLGGSIAEGFAKLGSKLVILGRTGTKIDAKVKELGSTGAEVLGIVCDVLDDVSIRESRDKIVRAFGKIDVLVNAAGGNVPGAVQVDKQMVFDLDISAIDQAIDLNLKGAIYPTLILGKVMAESGQGSVINISSMATYSMLTRVMGYSVAKTGINSFTQWMASELARSYGDKVRVNAIAPGFFIGEQNRKLLLNDDGTPTDRGKKVLDRTPMGRFGNVDELNGIVQFLCSDEASFITGAVIPVDGGFSAFSGI